MTRIRIMAILILPIIAWWLLGGALIEALARGIDLGAYNTRVVLLATGGLGAVYGVVGSFITLRRRALIGDVLAHAMLPGIAAAFLVMVSFGGQGKYTPGLLLGAVISGGIGMLAVVAITRTTRLKEDAAMGIVLSVMFGFGAALLGIIQKIRIGNAAGLETFLYGKTASILIDDARLIWIVGGAAAWCVLLLFKEMTVLCFDRAFAATVGMRPTVIDGVLLAAMTAATVIGLQAVGLILVVAMLIIPAAAARFWTDDARTLVIGAGTLGGVSSVLGAYLSAHVENWPAGATIVLIAAAVFGFSLLFGRRRGVVRRLWRQFALRRRIARQHLLRAMYELTEDHGADADITRGELLDLRSWSARQLHQLLRRARRADEVVLRGPNRWRLTAAGRAAAARLARNHRLWEMYLITHADIAPSHVDRDADQIEHVLSPAMIADLEAALQSSATGPLESPHDLPKAVSP